MLVALALMIACLPALALAPAEAPAPAPKTGASDELTWQRVPCPGQRPGPVPYPLGIDGRLDMCLQVPAVPGGTYHLSAVNFVSNWLGRTPPSTVPNGSTGAAPAVALTASPTSVRPGQLMTVTGTLRRPYRAESGHVVSFCWGGCPGGLEYPAPVQWRSPVTFVAHLRAPDAPWVQVAPDKVVSPVAGNYLLGVHCVLQSPKCGLRAAEGQVVVHLAASARYTCRTVPGCAALRVTPAVASPGQTVRVSGYLPLVEMNGPTQPVAGTFSGERGGLGRTGVNFGRQSLGLGGPTTVESGDGTLRVRPALSFSALGYIAPISQQPAGFSLISADPSVSSTLAWCAGSDVTVQGPARTYEVPTAGARALLLAAPAYAKLARKQDQFSSCTTVAVSGAGLFVGMGYAAVTYPAPESTAAVVTTDRGRTWSMVPVPHGSSPSGFAGFRPRANGDMEALFSPSSRVRAGPAVPLVEQYLSGTATWAKTSLSCPEVGPCITWGGGGPSDCGMETSGANALVSTDGGAHWRDPPGWLGQVATCWPAAIVTITRSAALIVGVNDGVGPYAGLYPLVMASDGGRRWQIVALPPVPGQLPGVDQQSLLVLPNGAVLSVSGPPWYLLPPRATRWCKVVNAPTQAGGSYPLPSSYTVLRGSVWWLQEGKAGWSAHHVAATSLLC